MCASVRIAHACIEFVRECRNSDLRVCVFVFIVCVCVCVHLIQDIVVEQLIERSRHSLSYHISARIRRMCACVCVVYACKCMCVCVCRCI